MEFAKLIKQSSASELRGKRVPLSNQMIEHHLRIGSDGSTFGRYLKGTRTISAARIARLIKILDQQYRKDRATSGKSKSAGRISPWVPLSFRLKLMSQGYVEKEEDNEARDAKLYYRMQASAEKAQLSYLSKATKNLRAVEEALKQLGNYSDEAFDLDSAPKKKPASSRWKCVIELHEAMRDVNAKFSRLVRKR